MLEHDSTGGWEKSAGAWIAAMGERGDFAREFILDPALLGRIEPGAYQNALDVGCGEGRFCRILQQMGIDVTGLDFAPSLLEHAVRMDPSGDYRLGSAEEMPFESESFDLVVSYMSLVSVANPDRAIAEMSRVLRRSGTLLIANLHSFVSAGYGSQGAGDVGTRFGASPYFDRSAKQVTWSGIDIVNWHRPLADYIQAFLEENLALRWFSEPTPIAGADPQIASPFYQVPHFITMEWVK